MQRKEELPGFQTGNTNDMLNNKYELLSKRTADVPIFKLNSIVIRGKSIQGMVRDRVRVDNGHEKRVPSALIFSQGKERKSVKSAQFVSWLPLFAIDSHWHVPSHPITSALNFTPPPSFLPLIPSSTHSRTHFIHTLISALFVLFRIMRTKHNVLLLLLSFFFFFYIGLD